MPELSGAAAAAQAPSTPVHGYLLLVGPDGAGKSTVIEALAARAATSGIPLQRRHSRPGFIAGRPVGTAPVTNPHGEPPRGLVGGGAKLAVVFLDHLVGGHVRWRPLRRRGLLVVERGWFDLRVDPRRYRLPRSVAALVAPLGRVLPRPDLVVLLSGDPVQLHERKPEIGAHEVERQIERWREVAVRAGRRVLEIDTVTAGADAVASSIMDALGTGRVPPSQWRRTPLTAPRVSLRTTGDAAAAMHVYQPFSPTARLGAALGTRVRRAGLPASEPVPDLDALLAHVGLSVHGVVAMRSSSPGRVVLATCRDGLMEAILKVGPGDDVGLRREAQMLRAPLRDGSSFRRPEVLWNGDWGDRYAVVTRATPPRTSRRWTVEDVMPILTDLGTAARDGSPVTHGDLAPWNLVRSASGPVLLDWEFSRFTDEPLFDLVHFVVQSGSLLGRYRPAEALTLLCGDGSPGARLLARRGRAPGEARELVHQHLLEWRPTEPRAQRFRDALVALVDG